MCLQNFCKGRTIRHTAGHGEAPFDERRDERREDLNYLRPKPMFESRDPKREARSKSNELAYEIRNSEHFHDITVFVSDYDQEKARRDKFEESFKEGEVKKKQDRERQQTERDKAKESAKEEQQRAGISNELRKKGVNEYDLPKRVESILEQRKKSDLDKEEQKVARAMDKAYLPEARKEMDRGEILVVPNRPGMAAAMAVGKWVVPHSSIKGTGQLNRHRVVQEALDKMGYVEHLGHNKVELHVKRDNSDAPVGKMEVWHGHCAEVGAVSDYLHRIDPSGRMTLEKARARFQKEDAEIFAHRPRSSDGTPATDYKAEVPACGSCHFMLTELGIKHNSSSK